MPALPAGQQIARLELLRSTSDLSKNRDARRYPVAALPLSPDDTTYLDIGAPQDVKLHYQLRVRTSTGQTTWSNVGTVVAPKRPLVKLHHPSLLVDKINYTLTVFDGNTAVRIFPIALGADCTKRKLHQDRASTPEGIYQISGLQPQATYYRAIDLNYPNSTDYRRYRFYSAHGLLPSPRPSIGGEIQIHGQGIESNWTWGCVALRNSDMDLLFSRPELRGGVEVRIVGSELRKEDLEVERTLTYADYALVKTTLKRAGWLVGNSPDDWQHALSTFQLKNGLVVTGILDRSTLAQVHRLSQQ